jgi:hypothetical protein
MSTPWGLRALRPGFAETPALDLAFALGWPELRYVGEAPPADLPAGVLRQAWTAAEAQAELRAALAPLEILKPADAIAPRHALALGRRVIPFGWPGTYEAVSSAVFLLEAIVGAGALAEGLVAALEEISANEWRRASPGATSPFYAMGLVLLRVEDGAAAGLRGRLAALWGKRKDDAGALTAAVDLVLHGAEGARRSGKRYGRGDADIDPASALLVDDDPALLTTIARADRFARYDRRHAARLAFLGDAATREAVARRWYAVGKKADQAFFLASVGAIAGDEMLEPTREATSASRVKKEAAAWLAARGARDARALAAPGAPVKGA